MKDFIKNKLVAQSNTSIVSVLANEDFFSAENGENSLQSQNPRIQRRKRGSYFYPIPYHFSIDKRGKISIWSHFTRQKRIGLNLFGKIDLRKVIVK